MLVIFILLSIMAILIIIVNPKSSTYRRGDFFLLGMEIGGLAELFITSKTSEPILRLSLTLFGILLILAANIIFIGVSILDGFLGFKVRIEFNNPIVSR